MGTIRPGAVLTGQRPAALAGAALAGATRALAALRPATKPLHPRGRTVTARLERRGSSPPAGVPWLDEQGTDDVVVRLSRAVGLPDALPDIHGMAVRLTTDTGPADLLLASTGWGRLGRFVFTASRQPSTRPLTTLLPYRTGRGPVLIGARAVAPDSYAMSWATLAGSWRPFGRLVLTPRLAADQGISFDPVRHQLPGLEQYPAVVRLREPSYVQARASSHR